MNIAADGDPERDGTGVDLVVDLIAPDGSTVLFSADSAGAGGPGNPPGEGFCFVVPSSGIYYVRVTGYGGGMGNYDLMVARKEFRVPMRLTVVAASPGEFSFSIPTAPGWIYQVQGSSDLGPQSVWSPAPGNNILQGSGDLMIYSAGGLVGNGCRYFRALRAPVGNGIIQ